MDSQNDHIDIDDNARDDIRKVLSKYYENDPKMIKQIDNILNNPEYDKKEEIDMADETKTTEQTNDQVKNDGASKKVANPFNREHLADILWDASIKHPFITLGLISGAIMIGSVKLTEHVISRGVHMGNMKTLKSIYRMTH